MHFILTDENLDYQKNGFELFKKYFRGLKIKKMKIKILEFLKYF